MKKVVISLLLIGFMGKTGITSAEIFRHTDDKGQISYSDKPSSTATRIKPLIKTYRYKYRVKRVYDGDTIILKNSYKVRLLGVNTPEIKSRHQLGEEGGKKARQWLKDKLRGGSVFIEYDQEKKDKYKRELAHLFLEDGEHLNKSLLEAGLASLSIIPPNLRYIESLQKAEEYAQKHQLGIWGIDAYQPIEVERLLHDDTISGWNRFLTIPKQITESRKYKRLVLGKQLDIRIAKSNLHYFPDLSNYIGKRLEVRGWASRKKVHFSILVRHPSAIKILQ